MHANLHCMALSGQISLQFRSHDADQALLVRKKSLCGAGIAHCHSLSLLTTCCGRRVAAAILVIDIELVFDARIASGRVSCTRHAKIGLVKAAKTKTLLPDAHSVRLTPTSSNRANVLLLRSSLSGTASIARST